MREPQETPSFGNGEEVIFVDLNNSILEDIRGAVGLTRDNEEFDDELLMHINASVIKLNQNGLDKTTVVNDDSTTWNGLYDPDSKGSSAFQAIPLFVMMSTKLIFDPPPPSTVDVYAKNVSDLLWRIKIACE